MDLFHALNTSATGLSAERLRMDVISSNIANANTTRTEKGGAYRRRVAVLAPQNAPSFQQVLQNSLRKQAPYSGVRVAEVVEDSSPLKRVYDPTHPDAGPDGYVDYPNVDIMKEMVELITASRSYEANATVLNSTKSMFLKTLEIGRL
ncbi:MAG TPA: flagellar basal body rod protein FlgC [Peptococcaceae bacterium]|jgi:flagellar basal-body rod protein FlgC|nr:flagellar basal body rod protein FlgC [Clostridia bacterium]HOB81304.1 flagellar basal body rod protein FlgC [Peptococcaceae bacterium]HPZ70578.1 flagellar basal body rod protein FlgC [Peptococcaceae bacterium]HQD53390.1 flagellar basal body rod protein FlgC [Peptococcaceae bacterium]